MYLKWDLATRKHEAEVKKAQLKKDSDEIQLEKVKHRAVMETKKEKSSLKIKAIHAKNVVAEATKSNTTERKVSELEEKKEKFSQRKQSSWRRDNQVSKIVILKYFSYFYLTHFILL